MWCRAIQKTIEDITQDEIENMCIEPERDCYLCMFCTAIGGRKLTEIEQERLNRKITKRKAKERQKKGKIKNLRRKNYELYMCKCNR